MTSLVSSDLSRLNKTGHLSLVSLDKKKTKAKNKNKRSVRKNDTFKLYLIKPLIKTNKAGLCKKSTTPLKKKQQKRKRKKGGKKFRKKARNDFEKVKKHPYPSRRSKAIYVKVHIFSFFVQYDFPSRFLNDPCKTL